MDRICDRLDFFRLMSFYYGGIGHYVSNTLVMFTLGRYVDVYDDFLITCIFCVISDCGVHNGEFGCLQ